MAALTCAAMSVSSEASPPRERWRMLAVLALVELLGMSLWFAANAVRDTL